ncbi:MAG: undecaprenyl-diphosphatase [Myxococcota bacterium]|jgi:undecaprenyl-diphosphatase
MTRPPQNPRPQTSPRSPDVESEESSILGAMFLGALQGLTEFLPVSSSGHLVLFQQFFEVGTEHVLFDLVLHLGTLVPVLWFYRAEVGTVLVDLVSGDAPWAERPGVRLAGLVVAASIPTAAIGLLFEDLFESLFSAPSVLTLTFALTGVLLWAAGRFDRSERAVPLTWTLALALGLAQGLAITPGISRSGTTIAVALMLGIRREEAARFSFLMSVPAIGGAALLKLKDADLATIDLQPLLAGGVTAMVVGYFALALLVRLVLSGQFTAFRWYAWGAAIAAGAIAVLA